MGTARSERRARRAAEHDAGHGAPFNGKTFMWQMLNFAALLFLLI